MPLDRKLGEQATKFTIVGMANFVLTFVVFTGLLQSGATSYLVALASAWIIGVIFSYVLNFVWVFKAETTFSFNVRFAKFFLSGMVSVTINALALRYFVEVLEFDPFHAQLLLMPLIVVGNFLAAKYWSMRASRLSQIDE
ncbi:hypothetical protein GCM10010520_50890 [Rhizobium viscosum]|uniref:Flippase GtrA n=1 Tax=Rhizobium viscosum TaxID=1673 RepID=A0ABR9IZE9_RHIVS|nr:GtrA family protein [Rhizobium viscosum]MBE1508590.1 putative flippase GtrA [Rhizobium viscosum]